MSTIIPEMTGLAWRDKQDEIRKRIPGIDRGSFVFSMTKAQYEQTYGTGYRKPGFLSRVLFTIVKVLPKIGPFRPLAFKPLTPETARLMDHSFSAARERYHVLLEGMHSHRAEISESSPVLNTDLDTGKPPAREYNPLLEETYAQLVERLDRRQFAGIPAALRNDLVRHYNTPITANIRLTKKQREVEARALRQLHGMQPADH